MSEAEIDPKTIEKWHDPKTGRFRPGNKYHVIRPKTDKSPSLENAIQAIAEKFPPERVAKEYSNLLDLYSTKLEKAIKGKDKFTNADARTMLSILENTLNRTIGKPVQRAEVKRENIEHLVQWLEGGQEAEEESAVDADIVYVQTDETI